MAKNSAHTENALQSGQLRWCTDING